MIDSRKTPRRRADDIAPRGRCEEQVADSARYDVLVVGGGPAGLSAALLLGRACRRVLVVDAGQPRNAKAQELHGYLGFEHGPPSDLRKLGRSQLRAHGIDVVDEEVVSTCQLPRAQRQGWPTGFQLETSAGMHFHGRKLLLAIGVKDDIPPIPGLEACYGISIHHCPYCDGWEHRGQRIAAFAEDADRAVSLGLSLRTLSDRVSVLTHGAAVSASQRRRLQRQGVGCRCDRIANLVSTRGQLRQVEFESGPPLPMDALFFNSAPKMTVLLPKMLRCALKDGCFARTEHKQCTNIRGLFVAGDADAHVQFAIVAAAEGATAATAINAELQREDLRRRSHSKTAAGGSRSH